MTHFRYNGGLLCSLLKSFPPPSSVSPQRESYSWIQLLSFPSTFLYFCHIWCASIKNIKHYFSHLKSLYKWYLVVSIPLHLGSFAQNCFRDLFNVDRCSSSALIFKCHMVFHCLNSNTVYILLLSILLWVSIRLFPWFGLVLWLWHAVKIRTHGLLCMGKYFFGTFLDFKLANERVCTLSAVLDVAR